MELPLTDTSSVRVAAFQLPLPSTLELGAVNVTDGLLLPMRQPSAGSTTRMEPPTGTAPAHAKER